MSKFLKLTAEITVAACAEAQDYDVATKARTPKKTKEGAQIWELTIPVKTKIKKGDLELEGLAYEKLNSLVKLPVGQATVELEMFEVADKIKKTVATYFRVTKLVDNVAPISNPQPKK